MERLPVKPEERVILAGLSGGGWTTTLVAALDPRIVAWQQRVSKGVKDGFRMGFRFMKVSFIFF